MNRHSSAAVNMDWTASIDIYCERIGPALFAEPLNLLTNAAFFVAAALAWRRWRRRYGGAPLGSAIGALLVLVVAIGAGSALFHSFATRWAQVADVAPIAAFMVLYFGYLVRVVFDWSWARVVTAYAAGAAATVAAVLLPADWFNGSNAYFGGCAALVGSAIVARRHAPHVAPWLWTASLVFAASLIFRSIDRGVCGVMPIGTHFLWHVCNGVLLYVLVTAAMYDRARVLRPPCV